VKRIFDPVHHFIELSTPEVQLLDLPVMQRLRRLRQLGLAYLAFPSAEHSRFTHALGALAMGTRAFDELFHHGEEFFTSAVDAAYQRRLVRASLLLHDIGHGPFSHSCEEVLGIRHEARTTDLLALPELAGAVAALDVDVRDVLGLILGDPHSRYPALRELVSGPNLDADRMDYLQRDAYFTGVATGRFDAEQLVASLRLYQRSEKTVVGIDRRGVVALESFVMARYMMFASVYFHHTTRMFEHVLHDMLRELWPNPRALDPIEEFLQWDDLRVLNALDGAPSVAARALRSESMRLPGSSTASATSPTLRRAKRRWTYVLASRTSGPTRKLSSCIVFHSESAKSARSGSVALAATSLTLVRHPTSSRNLVEEPSGGSYSFAAPRI